MQSTLLSSTKTNAFAIMFALEHLFTLHKYFIGEEKKLHKSVAVTENVKTMLQQMRDFCATSLCRK